MTNKMRKEKITTKKVEDSKVPYRYEDIVVVIGYEFGDSEQSDTVHLSHNGKNVAIPIDFAGLIAEFFAQYKK